MKDHIRTLVSIAVIVFVAAMPASAQTAPRSAASGQHEPATLQAAATSLWNHVLTRCHVADNSGTSFDYFYYNPDGRSFDPERTAPDPELPGWMPAMNYGFTQLGDVTFHVVAVPVSRAQSLNGLQWHGWAIIQASRFRYHNRRDRQWTSWSENVQRWKASDQAALSSNNENWYYGTMLHAVNEQNTGMFVDGRLTIYIENSNGVVKYFPYELHGGMPPKPSCSQVPGSTD